MEYYKKAAIWIIVIIVIILISAWVIYINFFFQVLNINPAPNSKINGGSGQVKFNFNKDLANIDLSKQMLATEGLSISAQINKGQLVLFVANINQAKKYQIELSNIKSKDGQNIKYIKYEFQGAFTPYGQLSDSDKKQQINDTDVGNINDPATNILPKYSDNFAIEYTLLSELDSKGKGLKLNIILLLDKFNFEDKATILAYKNEALKYLRDNGINPNDYQIVWTPEEAKNL